MHELMQITMPETPPSGPTRCAWADPRNPQYLDYHDHEWGRPCHDERHLFAMLNLEGAQAGLSWAQILKRRTAYRLAFDEWDAHKIAAYGEDDVMRLLANPGIVRNRLKIRACITNAAAYLRLCASEGSLDAYLWRWVQGRPVLTIGQPVSRSALSDAISADLKRRGFAFVGSTIVYAYLQAVGVLSDHDAGCAWRSVSGKRS